MWCASSPLDLRGGVGASNVVCVAGCGGTQGREAGWPAPVWIPFCVTSAEVVRVRVCGLGSARLLWCGWGLGERGSDLTGLGWTGKFGQVAPR